VARVVVLTRNPAVDVTYRVAEQRIGETVRVSAVTRRPGGKGLNVVAVLAQLGVAAVALQPLGGGSGRWIEESLAAADAGADILKPNEAEARDATGTDTLDDAGAALLARGAGCVVVSRGRDGLAALEADGSRHRQPAVPGVNGNPTGAGDAATAGLVAALLSDRPLEEALRWASVVGGAAVLAPVAGSIDVADLPLLADRLPAGDRPTLPSPIPTR
jgi:fructose-1-phosphate kinase PfkB-like protein